MAGSLGMAAGEAVNQGASPPRWRRTARCFVRRRPAGARMQEGIPLADADAAPFPPPPPHHRGQRLQGHAALHPWMLTNPTTGGRDCLPYAMLGRRADRRNPARCRLRRPRVIESDREKLPEGVPQRGRLSARPRHDRYGRARDDLRPTIARLLPGYC